MLRLPLLGLLAVGASAQAAQPIPAVGQDGVVNTLQDMVDASSATKAQFSAFSDRVYSDVDRLQHEFQKERQEIADLKLQKQSMQAEQEKQRLKLSRELEDFKRRTLGKLSDLQVEDKRLEEQNTNLVATNTKLATDLEAEKSKKEVMVKKLKKFAELFNHQNAVVNQMYQSQQKRVSDEVAGDMKDAMEIAGPDTSAAPATPAALVLPPIPAAPPVAPQQTMDPLEAEMTLPTDLAVVMPAAVSPPVVAVPVVQPPALVPVVDMPIPQPQVALAPAPSSLRRPAAVAVTPTMLGSPHAALAHHHSPRRVLNTPRPPTAPLLAKAPAAGVPPQPAAVVQPPPIVEAAQQPVAAEVPVPSAVADDDQLKSLRSEVEKLEASVKEEDAP